MHQRPLRLTAIYLVTAVTQAGCIVDTFVDRRQDLDICVVSAKDHQPIGGATVTCRAQYLSVDDHWFESSSAHPAPPTDARGLTSIPLDWTAIICSQESRRQQQAALNANHVSGQKACMTISHGDQTETLECVISPGERVHGELFSVDMLRVSEAKPRLPAHQAKDR